MQLDNDSCYRALAARDRRFDGRFFVGVSTTGVYCRPVCVARLPRRDRCTFYRAAAEAESAGFRACLRCRPELAPGRSPVDALPQLVARAVARIDAGALDHVHGGAAAVAALADELGVTARHLRRAMNSELGVAPLQLAQSRRLALAKQLVRDTELKLSEIAFASGFNSVRRFNAAFRERFARAPSSLRRPPADRRVRRNVASDAQLAEPWPAFTLTLCYRPPLAWDATLDYLATRAVEPLERVDRDTGSYVRALRVRAPSGEDVCGLVEASHDPERFALRARISTALAPAAAGVVAQLRAAFDLDAEPGAIGTELSRSDPTLAQLCQRTPGLRLPGVFDPFEGLARAIVGQQVSLAAARTLLARVVRRFGTRNEESDLLVFPKVAALARAEETQLTELGLTGSRARSVVACAAAMHSGQLRLDRGVDLEATRVALEALPGVGPWTAARIALHVLGDADALPASDLALRHALGGSSAAAVLARAEAWRPWRAYGAMQLWHASAAARQGDTHD